MDNTEISYLDALDGSSVQQIEDQDTALQPKNVKKYNKTIVFIEDELYHTLNYLNNQLDMIDDQTNSKEGNEVPFNRSVFEAKKLIVEQKLVTLRSLASMASEQMKLTSKTKDNEIVNITALFAD